MTLEEYRKQALANLRLMSRTANGEVDTSASADKEKIMAVSSGDTAKTLADRNFKEALKMAWENRFRVFSGPEDLRSFIEDLAREVNRGLLKDGVLYRRGADSEKYRYTPTAQLEASAAWFYEHLFSLLCREPFDAAEAAASAEYYINLTCHLFADGCGKCAMVTAAWLLMRGNHPLPVYPGREAYYGVCKTFRHGPVASENDRADFAGFLPDYRGLFREEADAVQENMKALTILLPNKIFTGNAAQTTAQIDAIRHRLKPEALSLDAERLQYITSVGLRMLLNLINEYNTLSIFNVGETVYETLDISGFTSLMQVDRALKTVSTEGCELIGKGQNGSVYRYAPDTVVKVYSDKNKLEDVRRENQMSRFCFVSGLPTAIPLNLVRVGEQLGAMYEMLDAQSLTHEIITKPERREELINAYIALIRKIHGIVPQAQDLPRGLALPRLKEKFIGWATDLEEVIGRETADQLRGIIGAIPKKNTLLHGDLHTSNIMDVGGELILIDLDGIGLGDPVFDLANIAATLNGFPALVHRDALEWGDPELRAWVLQRTLDGYYAGLEEAEREAQKRLVMLCMHTRVARYGMKHDTVSETDRKEELKRLYELVQAYH